MTTTSPAHSAILSKLSDLGYTPSVKDLPALVAYADEPESDDKLLLRALVRIGPNLAHACTPYLETHLRAAPLLLRAVGKSMRQTGSDAAALKRYFLPLLEANSPRTRREAIVQLGKSCEVDTELEDLLLAKLLAPHDDAERRALTEALGKVGSHKAYEALQRAGAGRSAVIAARNATRGNACIAHDAPLPPDTLVAFRTRRGLERVLRTELRAKLNILPEKTYPGLTLVRGIPTLAAALSMRTWVDIGLAHLAPRPNVADALRALAPAMGALTTGTATYRLDLPKMSRGALWAEVERLAELTELQNDPKEALWELAIEPGVAVAVAWAKAVPDTRFAYRVMDVPASSHPTIAAALAHIGGVQPDDVVWDPFVGAGLELAERAHLGPYARLIGTDLSNDALSAARANLVHLTNVDLRKSDALTHMPGAVTLILSNPPMGRRVRRDGDLADDLVHFVQHASNVLAVGGRLVWLSPFPAETALAAKRYGLDVETAFAVDLGGYDVELQRIVKRRG